MAEEQTFIATFLTIFTNKQDKNSWANLGIKNPLKLYAVRVCEII